MGALRRELNPIYEAENGLGQHSADVRQKIIQHSPDLTTEPRLSEMDI